MMHFLHSNKIKLSLLLAILAGSISSASAHSPYILPNVFDIPDNGVVTLDASLGEYLFIPDYVIEDDGFVIMLPDGSKTSPENLVEFKTRTVMEQNLRLDGTYRFSTGWRDGGLVKEFNLDGRERRIRGDDAELPEGAELTGMYRTLYLAETYVTKGAPTDTVLVQGSTGLEFLMVSHPNDVFVDEAVSLRVLLDGDATAGVTVNISLAARQMESSPGEYIVTSDAQGEITFTPQKAGVYIMKAEHNVPAQSAQDVENNYIYTVVFEVTE